jgi:S-formylglutathione hydrolase FrmB
MALLHCDYFSDVLGLATSMDVILPESTAAHGAAKSPGPKRPFRTLYLLHGLSDDHTGWQRRTSIERYVAPLGLAVVMPAAHRSFYTDMDRGLRYWTHVSKEVPARAREFFHLSDRREDNFAAGLSMGGYGAFKLALRHPDRFAAAASLSGAVDMAARPGRVDNEFTHEMENVFGDLDALGGSDNDLFRLVEKLANTNGDVPKLYQCCGTEDALLDENRRFHEHARKLGLDLVYEEGHGGHEWGFWDRWIQRVLTWLPLGAGD